MADIFMYKRPPTIAHYHQNKPYTNMDGSNKRWNRSENSCRARALRWCWPPACWRQRPPASGPCRPSAGNCRKIWTACVIRPAVASTAPGIDEGLDLTTPDEEDSTEWQQPTAPAANSVANVPKASSSTAPSGGAGGSSGASSGSAGVREPSALQTESAPASSSAAPASTRPVSGRILNAYSGDELVYNKTLGDWRTHNGIDYAAAKGEKVSAPAAGKVTLAGADGKLGPYRGH